MPKTIALARFSEQLRRAGHTFHSTSYGDARLTERDCLGCKHNALETRSADLVDRRGPHAIGQTSAEHRLPCWCLAEICLEDTAYIDLVNMRAE
jgi:hypothetical protein